MSSEPMPALFLTRRLAIVFLALALGSCGFRLAGTASLPPELSQIHLTTTEFNKRQRDVLLQRLRLAGAEIVAEANDQAVQLRVRLLTLPDRRLVTSASNGKIIERVTRGLEFSLKDADGKPLLPAKTLQRQKDIVLNDDNLLSSDVERKNVVEDLEAALFNQLIFQLQRL
ncbi:MAG: hypothetical protein JSU67_03570 [Gammaproteobacteria bacterium]|nr:MAG: hypothetical protein JSU67_03570 [Gammaproteobacteria bacterium]